MRSHILDGYRYDFVNHFRIFHGAGLIEEGYEVEVYPLDPEGRETGRFNWYPHSRRQRAGESHHQAVYWSGQEVLPVYENQGTEDDPIMVQVGTKRGADWRARLFPTLQFLVKKREIALAMGIEVGQVTTEDCHGMRPDQPDPVEIRGLPFDDAVREVWGEDPNIVTPAEKPRGTIVNIDCDFDGQAQSNNTNADAGSILEVGINSTITRRPVLEFPLAALTGAASVNDLDFQGRITSSATGWDATDQLSIRPYGAGGTGHPSSDSGATRYAACDDEAAYFTGASDNSAVNFVTTGSHTMDLGTTADGDLFAAISSPGRFALTMLHGTGVVNGETAPFESLENAGTDPCTLVVDYTAGGVSHAADAALTVSAVLAAAAALSLPAVQTLTASATFAGLAGYQHAVVSAFAVTATFAADATVTKPIATAFSVTATLAATASTSLTAASALTATGTFTGAATATYQASLAASVTATWAADAYMAGLQAAVAAFTVTATVALLATANYRLTTALTATATLAAVPLLNLRAATALTVTGTFAAASTRSLGALTALSVTATMSANSLLTLALTSALQVTATLSANARATMALQAALPVIVVLFIAEGVLESETIVHNIGMTGRRIVPTLTGRDEPQTLTGRSSSPDGLIGRVT